MPILVICKDSKNAPHLRQEYLQAHLDYIETVLDQVLIAGPQKPINIDNASPHGSTFIYATDSLEQAQTLFQQDPYVKNGVYEHVEFHHFTPAAGTWINGKIW